MSLKSLTERAKVHVKRVYGAKFVEYKFMILRFNLISREKLSYENEQKEYKK